MGRSQRICFSPPTNQNDSLLLNVFVRAMFDVASGDPPDAVLPCSPAPTIKSLLPPSSSFGNQRNDCRSCSAWFPSKDSFCVIPPATYYILFEQVLSSIHTFLLHLTYTLVTPGLVDIGRTPPCSYSVLNRTSAPFSGELVNPIFCRFSLLLPPTGQICDLTVIVPF